MTRASIDVRFVFGFAVTWGLSATTGALACSCGDTSLGRSTAAGGASAVCLVFVCSAAGGGSVDAKLRLLVDGPALAVADTREIAAMRINLRIWIPFGSLKLGISR